MQVSVTSGTWNINRSGAGQLFHWSRGAERNHNSFKQILVKSGEKKKRPLIMVNNRSIKRKNCFRPSVLEGIFLFGASIRAGWILGACITFKRNWRGEQTLQCQWGESQLSGHSGHRARLSVCQQQIRASDLFCTISFPFPQTIAARHLDDTSSPQQIHLSIKHWATWNETKANTSKKKTLD